MWAQHRLPQEVLDVAWRGGGHGRGRGQVMEVMEYGHGVDESSMVEHGKVMDMTMDMTRVNRGHGTVVDMVHRRPIFASRKNLACMMFTTVSTCGSHAQ